MVLAPVPMRRVGLGVGDADRRLLFHSGQRIEVANPLLPVLADVEEHAAEGGVDAYRVGAFLEHPRRHLAVAVVEAQVAQFEGAARHLLRLRHRQPALDLVDGVHRAGIVQVVGGDERGIEGPGPTGAQELLHEVVLRQLVAEDLAHLQEVLADVVAEIGVLRFVGVGRWVHRVGSGVAEGAAHAHHVGPLEVAAGVVVRVVPVALGVPGAGIEARVGEQAQPHHAARTAVGALVDAVVEVVLLALRLVDVEAEAVGLGGPLVARLVDDAVGLEALGARRRHHLQQVGGTESVLDQPVPEAGVVPGPQVPEDAAAELLVAQLHVPPLEAHAGERIEVDLVERIVGRARGGGTFSVGAAERQHSHQAEVHVRRTALRVSIIERLPPVVDRGATVRAPVQPGSWCTSTGTLLTSE